MLLCSENLAGVAVRSFQVVCMVALNDGMAICLLMVLSHVVSPAWLLTNRQLTKSCFDLASDRMAVWLIGQIHFDRTNCHSNSAGFDHCLWNSNCCGRDPMFDWQLPLCLTGS